MSDDVKLGERVRDRVTGFEGTAIGRAEYLYDVASVLVAAETKQAAADSRWLAETRLEPVPPGATGFSAS
jgi:hypothetical protein